jgi:hypothetical protein
MSTEEDRWSPCGPGGDDRATAASAAPPAGQPGNPELPAALPAGLASRLLAPERRIPAAAASRSRRRAIWRVDPGSAEKTLYESGLPPRLLPRRRHGYRVHWRHRICPLLRRGSDPNDLVLHL